MKETSLNKETKQISQVITSETFSEETGEIIDSESKVTSKYFSREPNFIKIYLQDILYLSDLTTSYHGVLYAIIKRMDYDNVVYLMKNNKTKIAEECKLEINTVAKAIVQLTKKQILIQTGRGEYMVNPYLFGKGQWNDIKSLRIKLDYTSAGRTWSTSIVKETQDSIFDELPTSQAV